MVAEEIRLRHPADIKALRREFKHATAVGTAIHEITKEEIVDAHAFRDRVLDVFAQGSVGFSQEIGPAMYVSCGDQHGVWRQLTRNA
jgi:hypothetical protein